MRLAAFSLLISCSAPPSIPAPAAPLTRPTPPEPCEEFERELECPPTSHPELALRSDNGREQCELWCANYEGIRDGAFRWYERKPATLLVEGSFEGGQKSGKWITFGTHTVTLETIVISEENYRAGKHHGTTKRWHDNGALAASSNWIDGQRDGNAETYGPDGQWLSRGRFDEGVPIGVHEERYLNGQLTSRRTYDDSGRPHGDWCFWLSDGTEIGCQNIVEGTGRVVEYDRKGEVSRISELQNGKLHGTLTEFTFATKYEATYVQGQQHGPSTVTSLDDGCVESSSVWSNDKLDGPHLQRDCTTGVVTVTGQYCKDEMCGRWEMRDGSGRLVEVNEYTNEGKLLGRIVYGDDGQVDKF